MKNSFIATLLIAGASCALAQTRFEAEAAIPATDHSATIVTAASASGGSYVEMREGTLSFSITVANEGFYTLWANYAQPNDQNGKIQNLVVNGSSAGQISFPYSSTFINMKASSKMRLRAGANTVEITKSWGWVNIDYVEITPYVPTPFNISPSLVTPNASDNAKKMYGFLLQNFLQKTISGVMTNTVMQNDGRYTPVTVPTQTEVAWIINASGKTPALLGLDFMHATGKASEGEWHRGYTNATVALAQDIFNRGGIPIYCWHWKDPSKTVEAFYSPSSGNTPNVTFNLNKAFTDSNTYAAFNTSSAEYTAILADIDTIARYLKVLQSQNVPVLWRPLHESSGKWFWWGYKGAAASKALYLLVFDRLVHHHALNNLIWVWTSDEAGDAMDWYPGDDYVDIVGRDYYYYPREANHSSLVASFEKVKEIYQGKKIIALSENGSIPHPDSMVADGAHWSFFMPWYGDYTMDGWAHDNTAADWNSIMNHSYVITLDEMPGWSQVSVKQIPSKLPKAQSLSIHAHQGFLLLDVPESQWMQVDLFDVHGRLIQQVYKGQIHAGRHRFNIPSEIQGMAIARIKSPHKNQVQMILNK